MKRTAMAAVVLVVSGCTAHEVHCDSKLEPINQPATSLARAAAAPPRGPESREPKASAEGAPRNDGEVSP